MEKCGPPCFQLASFLRFIHAKVSATCILTFSRPRSCVKRIPCFSLASPNTRLNCLFSSLINGTVSRRVPVILRQFHVWFPDVPGDYLLTGFAFGALGTFRALPADNRIALVFPAAISVGCGIMKRLVIWADNTIIVFIIDILILFEEAVFCHGAFVWRAGDPTTVDNLFHNG